MKIMDPKERFSGYNNEELSFIDKKFSDIFKIERDLLLNIFECRDSINYQISCLSVKEKVTESQRELLNALLDSKRDLFKKFFINYCKSKDLLKFSENFSDKLEKYEEIDDTVRYSLGVKIFNNVSKDNVLNFFDKPLEYDDIYVFVDDFVSSFVDSIEDYLSTFLYEGASEQISKDFVIYFKNILSKFVKSKISKKVNIDLNDLFTLVSDIVFSSVTNDVLIGIYYEFLVLQKYSEFLEKNVSASGDDYINYDFDDNEVVVPCVSLLLRRTGINDSDILNKSGGPVFYKREIENDIKNFVTNGLDIGKSFEDMDDYKFFEKMYTFHLDGSQYEKWKNMFLKRIKFPVKTGDLKLMNTEDSDDIVRYISSLRDEYPKAKDYIGKIGAHKLKDMKVDFLKLHFGGLLDELSDLLDNKVYKESSIVQLFKIMYIYLGILKGSKFTLDDDFVEYIKEFLKKSFRESHQSVENKKKDKDNVVKGNLGKDSLPQAESLGKLEIPAEKESIDGGFSKKDILPQKFLEDLDFYFKSVDTEFSDDEKRVIISAIKKLPYRSLSEKEPKKYYKKSWFKTFKLNDIFFEILDNNGYICEPDNVEEVEVPTEIIESPVISIDPLFLKIQKFLSKISKCDDIEGKVDICIDELTSLGYSFYRGKLKFRNRLIELFKSNPNFFTAFSNTMTSLLQGSVFFEKKAKKYDSKSVYGLDIGGKTGFRLVVLEGKSIFDIMEHGFYENFLNKKCSGK